MERAAFQAKPVCTGTARIPDASHLGGGLRNSQSIGHGAGEAQVSGELKRERVRACECTRLEDRLSRVVTECNAPASCTEARLTPDNAHASTSKSLAAIVARGAFRKD